MIPKSQTDGRAPKGLNPAQRGIAVLYMIRRSRLPGSVQPWPQVAVILFLRHGPSAYTKATDRHRSRAKAATVTPSTFRGTEPLVLLYNPLHSVKDLRRS